MQQYGQKSVMAGLGCGGAGGEQWLESGTILKVQLTECGGGEKKMCQGRAHSFHLEHLEEWSDH